MKHPKDNQYSGSIQSRKLPNMAGWEDILPQFVVDKVVDLNISNVCGLLSDNCIPLCGQSHQNSPHLYWYLHSRR